MAVARKDKQPSTVSPVNFPVCTRLFEPSQPPGSDKPVPDAAIAGAILAAGRRHRPDCHYAELNALVELLDERGVLAKPDVLDRVKQLRAEMRAKRKPH